MVNNECSQKTENLCAAKETPNENRQIVDPSKFYQTKLNFKIQKLNSNLNAVVSIPKLDEIFPLKNSFNSLKQLKQVPDIKKKAQKIKKKTYKKVDYKSLSTKGK